MSGVTGLMASESIDGVPLSLPEASLRTWVSARASIRCLPHSSFGSADIEGVGVSRIDRERVHPTAYDIIVGEKSAERPDGTRPSARAPEQKMQSPKAMQIEAFTRSFIAVLP
jgi:hypothetical protein